MNFKKWIKSIQTAGYNGACKVFMLVTDQTLGSVELFGRTSTEHRTFIVLHLTTLFPSRFDMSSNSRMIVRFFLFWSRLLQLLLISDCAFFLFIRLLQEFYYFVKWDTIVADDVENILSMHLSTSGILIILSLVWKVLIPSWQVIDGIEVELEEDITMEDIIASWFLILSTRMNNALW